MKAKVEDQKIIEEVLRGGTLTEVAHRLGYVSPSYIGKVLERNGLSKNKINDIRRRKQIESLRIQGKSYQEIAELLGISRDYAKDLCHRYKLGYSDEELQKARERGGEHLRKEDSYWQERVQKKYKGEYEFLRVVGIKNHESQIEMRCKRCGSHIVRSAISLRQDGAQKCPECFMQERKMRKEEEQYQREEAKRLRDVRRPITQLGFKFCECGELITTNASYCDECREKHKRIMQRKHERKKETIRRLRSNGGDFDISLERLYERDNGKCYLCGKQCDWNDYQIIDGAFVVGYDYPTVEHCIPLSKGGKHEWNNIKLACFICNTRKGSKVPPSKK